MVGAEVIGEGETEGRLLTVSEDGTGRRRVYDDYRAQSRGGFGSMNYRTDTYGLVAAVKKIYDDEDVILISSAGIIIRLDGAEVRECARPSKGVRLIKLGEGDQVIAVTTAKKAPQEDAEDAADAVADDGTQEEPREETAAPADAAPTEQPREETEDD